jgi:hypothetical protein
MKPEFESPETFTFLDDVGEPPPRGSFYPQLVEDVRRRFVHDPDRDRVSRIEATLGRLPNVSGEEREREYVAITWYLRNRG